ncbi:MAG: penicillin-binding protein 1C [Bdellovibrionales bacterium]
MEIKRSMRGWIGSRLRSRWIRNGIGLGALAVAVTLVFTWFQIPSATELRDLAMGSDQVLLAADSQVAQTRRTDFHKRRLAWYPLDAFSPPVRRAVIMAEDKRFWNHPGVDPIGFLRAAFAVVRGDRVQGGSTISMQLVDLIQPEVLLHNRRIRKGSVLHKLTQIRQALVLEWKWSKTEILEAYLNLIHLRGEFQGVPAMSHAYLHKYPQALGTTEAAIIAALIASPNQGRGSLERKACQIYSRLAPHSTGCEALKRTVATLFQSSPELPAQVGHALHLARRVFQDHPREPLLRSTVDLRLQTKVESILAKHIAYLKDRNVEDSAAIVIENASGRVLAYVGAVPNSPSPHVDGVRAPRQAGSTLKPFIYGKALENGTLTPASIILDDPTAISWSGGVYRPTNYDRQFFGPVSVREALGSSLNVPAVKVVTMIGLHETYRVLQELRFSQLREPDFYGVSMALGAVEVRLDELANAYRTLANGGVWSPLRFTGVNEGEESESAMPKQRILSSEVAYQLGSILSDPAARAIGFGWETPLETPFWAAVKTGTSKDYRDNWCVGFSSRYTVAVWAGNFNSAPMREVSGVSGAGPSWYEIMSYLHRQERSVPPEPPPGIIKKEIRHQWASHPYTEYFRQGTEPVHTVLEAATDQRVRFVFPAEGSVLVKDPHLDSERVALFIRFKGSVPQGSRLVLNNKLLGDAVSPFKLENPEAGHHQLKIVDLEGQVLSAIHFTVRGS